MLYELACSQVPFDAENPLGILTQHMYVAPVPPNERVTDERKIPVGLEAIILKCLSKNPDLRYASMQALYDDLQRVARGAVPEAVGDLLSRGSDELPLNRLRSAAQAIPSATSATTSFNWLGVALTSILVVVLLAVIFAPLNGQLFGNDAVVVTGSQPTAEPLLGANKPMYTVALVLAPIDAHVFDGNDDLGTMPISIQLGQGEVATVDVRREGFTSQQVLIDGTRSKLIVQLEPLPGADLTTLPSAAGHPSLRPDAGTRIVKLGSAANSPSAGRHRDAGAPQRRKRGTQSPVETAPSPTASGTPSPSATGSAATPSAPPSATAGAPAAPLGGELDPNADPLLVTPPP
jgi:serine/threonine-protein kinase